MKKIYYLLLFIVVFFMVCCKEKRPISTIDDPIYYAYKNNETYERYGKKFVINSCEIIKCDDDISENSTIKYNIILGVDTNLIESDFSNSSNNYELEYLSKTSIDLYFSDFDSINNKLILEYS